MGNSTDLVTLAFDEIKKGIDAIGGVRFRNLKRIVLLTGDIQDLIDTSEIVTPLCQKLDKAYPVEFSSSKGSPPEVDLGGALEVSVENKDSYEFQEGDYAIELGFIYDVVRPK